MLVGSVDLSAHPYRLRSAEEPRDLADALAAKLADPVDGAQVPFAATAGALAALTGLPRGEVPGVRVLEPGCFDVTSETTSEPGGETRAWIGTELSAETANGEAARARGEASVELGAILDGQDRQGRHVPGPARHLEPARVRHRRHRRGQVADGPAPAGAADRGRDTVARDRAGQVRVRGHGRPDRGRRPGDGDQPVRSGGGAAVGEPAGARARLPGAGAHRHGAGAVPGRLRRPGAVPADHLAGAAAGLRGLRLGSGDRRRPAGRARARPPSPPWPSCSARRSR